MILSSQVSDDIFRSTNVVLTDENYNDPTPKPSSDIKPARQHATSMVCTPYWSCRGTIIAHYPCSMSQRPAYGSCTFIIGFSTTRASLRTSEQEDLGKRCNTGGHLSRVGYTGEPVLQRYTCNVTKRRIPVLFVHRVRARGIGFRVFIIIIFFFLFKGFRRGRLRRYTATVVTVRPCGSGGGSHTKGIRRACA